MERNLKTKMPARNIVETELYRATSFQGRDDSLCHFINLFRLEIATLIGLYGEKVKRTCSIRLTFEV